LVQQIVFFFGGFIQTRQALAHDHVTGGASATLVASVFNRHTMVKQGLTQGVAGQTLDFTPLRTVLSVGQYFDDGHFKLSMCWPLKA
jgi:hypothetical protein